MSDTKTETKPEYNKSIAPLFKAKRSGNLTVAINPERFDALQNVKVGGMFLVRYLMPNQIKTEKSPVAYLDYVTPERLEELKNERDTGKAAEVI